MRGRTGPTSIGVDRIRIPAGAGIDVGIVDSGSTDPDEDFAFYWWSAAEGFSLSQRMES